MATFLFDEVVFGPIKSRRLGVSLGVNLLPVNRKVCSFNCIYCECGWNPESKAKGDLPTREQVYKALEKKLFDMAQQHEMPDVITFAGNGEPTLHPEFARIIDDTVELRNKYAYQSKIAVLSNSTQIHKPVVVNALLKIDDIILKLDSGVVETITALNCPTGCFNLMEVVENLKKFEGKCIIQTMFLRGEYQGKKIDNTTETEINAWIVLLKMIQPQKVMIYSIDRDTPAKGLEKISRNELETIAQKVKTEAGIEVDFY